MIKEAVELLTTILFNPTRKGLNCLLKGLQREEKYRIFRNFVSNFPEHWLFKFEKPGFDDWRLEKLDNQDMDEEELEALMSQEYLEEKDCCGNFNFLPCIIGAKNDSQNQKLTEDNAILKSQQCKTCYWYHTAMSIIVEGPECKENDELSTLINELDDSLELFQVPLEEYFISASTNVNDSTFATDL